MASARALEEDRRQRDAAAMAALDAWAARRVLPTDVPSDHLLALRVQGAWRRYLARKAYFERLWTRFEAEEAARIAATRRQVEDTSLLLASLDLQQRLTDEMYLAKVRQNQRHRYDSSGSGP
ncbi:hypothetical protein ACHHYP_13577 [Achlya hypogyna]|uniref:Uncharacterized protein n=1 Tax=Achlya hypogyna TaxID=1202772 RepID=A0A1V9YF84_ACHHY|nr:hypothetical protein ACHHYP_13577 [Achlya hypogyna]